MIIKEIKVRGHKKLLLLFAGWGMDEQLFNDYDPNGYDFMLVYNYSSLDFNTHNFKAYQEIKVLAWSLGVWAASQVLERCHLPVSSSSAINGTITPIDNNKGIPEAIYKGTLTQLSEASLFKFRRRICGTADCLSRFLAKAPKRSLEDLKFELEAVYQGSKHMPVSKFQWGKAFISKNDLAFPTKNQLYAWDSIPNIVINEPHYPENLFRDLLS